MRKLTVVFIAIGVLVVAGGAAAASKYVITSVHQIKPSVVAKLRGHRGSAGLRGPAGQTGPQGTAGLTSVKEVVGPVADASPCCDANSVVVSTATCPAGTIAVAGGWLPDQNNLPVTSFFPANGPSGANGWTVILANVDTSGSQGIEAVATCALGGIAPSAYARTALAVPVKAVLAAARRALIARGAQLASGTAR